ncbi:unnamed protein product [Chrysodeixis includens]|uniref:Uncharacterized protein n=1 Tax=Chrysodeixis includens TaxID=689277 RepID=A0A9N8L5G8_CHRIL|nr:unnamed protein product [Chrysodeixis includens]
MSNLEKMDDNICFALLLIQCMNHLNGSQKCYAKMQMVQVLHDAGLTEMIRVPMPDVEPPPLPPSPEPVNVLGNVETHVIVAPEEQGAQSELAEPQPRPIPVNNNSLASARPAIFFSYIKVCKSFIYRWGSTKSAGSASIYR